MPKQKDNRSGVHGSSKKVDGILTLAKKKEHALTVLPLPAVCSSCGKETLYKNVNDAFVPSKCPGCERVIENIYVSEQTGVLTAWGE